MLNRLTKHIKIIDYGMVKKFDKPEDSTNEEIGTIFYLNP